MTLYPSTVLMPKFDQGRAHTEKKKALMGQAEADRHKLNIHGGLFPASVRETSK